MHRKGYFQIQYYIYLFMYLLLQMVFLTDFGNFAIRVFEKSSSVSEKAFLNLYVNYVSYQYIF